MGDRHVGGGPALDIIGQPVSKEDFFKPIYERKLDVQPRITSRFPYTSLWEFRFNRAVYGKTVDSEEGGRIMTTYYLAKAVSP